MDFLSSVFMISLRFELVLIRPHRRMPSHPVQLALNIIRNMFFCPSIRLFFIIRRFGPVSVPVID